MKIAAFFFLVALIAPPTPHAWASSEWNVGDLRCEYQTNPLGIDARIPRFSWVASSRARGTRQTAYEVLVYSNTPPGPRSQTAIWSSGRVDSDNNVHVEYGGPPLESRGRYHWMVRVWDQHGRVAVSRPAHFEMGLLQASDWKGKWIGISPLNTDERLPLVGAKWIWLRDVSQAASAKRVALRKTFVLPPTAVVRRAELVYVGPRVGMPWEDDAAHVIDINGRRYPKFSSPHDDPRRFDVTSALRPGDNVLTIESPFAPQEAAAAVLMLDMENGTRLRIDSDDTWMTNYGPSVKTGDGNRKTSAWQPARELGPFGQPQNGDASFARADKLVPPAYLRRAFTANRSVRTARLYITATGVYETHLNGAELSDHRLAPGWTDYGARLRYQTYDVTTRIRKGTNVLGVIVADGWFSGRNGAGQNIWGVHKALLAQLHLEFDDGSTQVIATDDDWQGNTGPYRSTDLFDGVVYDARRELPGWSARVTKNEGWRAVVPLNPTVGVLQAPIEAPERITQIIPAVSVTKGQTGQYVFDLGQNIAGNVKVRLRAPAGREVTLRYAEVLNPDGSLFTSNLRTAGSTDRYIAKGSGVELFEPRFTYHGFRYVEVEGAVDMKRSDLQGVVTHTDVPRVGTFKTSDRRLNQLHANMTWTARNNFHSIPTDCPQRDERMGWAADIVLFAPAAAFSFDLAAFLSKYATDLRDAQLPNGSFPDVAPSLPFLAHGSYAWADAGVMLPWWLYQRYGDKRVLEQGYDAMVRWVDYKTSRSPNLLNKDWSFGDWLSLEETPHKILAPLYHQHVALLVAKIAGLLGKQEDAQRFNTLANDIRRAYQKAFVAADGSMGVNTQTAYAVALHFDAYPPQLRQAGERKLAQLVEQTGHLKTGLLGTAAIMPALSRAGRDDLAYSLLMRDTYPSWLQAVNAGATTLWERWDSYDPNRGPENRGDMNSLNQYALGSVGGWIYPNVAGIASDPEAPGFKRVIIRPVPGGGITSATAEHASVRGMIRARWTSNQQGVSLAVEVPVHATARVFVPSRAPALVTERGRPASVAPGVTPLAPEPGFAVFDVQSGRYDFHAPAAPVHASTSLGTFEFTLYDIPFDQRVPFLQSLGYDHLVLPWPDAAKIRKYLALPAVRSHAFAIKAVLTAIDGAMDDDVKTAQLLEAMQGQVPELWVTINGLKGESLNAAVRKLATMAEARGVTLVLYPHVGYSVASAQDAVSVINGVNHANVRFALNMAQEQKGGRLKDWAQTIAQTAHLAVAATINGTNREDGLAVTDFTRTILPLDEGDVDVGKAWLQPLRRAGFSRSVTLHTWNVKGQAKDHFARSMHRWKELQRF